MLKKSLIGAAVVLAMVSTSALAAVSAEEAARLGNDLTPVGAEKAGNAAGTIPAWTGGLTEAPANWKRGDQRPNPFADEKSLFTITAANMEQYAEQLTDGQKALLKQYPEFTMPVYTTHRSAALPQHVYDNTKQAATAAKLTQGGNAVEGVWGAIPFPIPSNGNEVMMNHNLRFVGTSRNYDSAVENIIYNNDQRLDYAYSLNVHHTFYDPAASEKDKSAGIIFKYASTVQKPSRDSGEGVLAQENIDGFNHPRKAWTYDPGERRVRRAPNLAFDTPDRPINVIDDFDMFSGALTRYDWKLIGKKEIYVPYNNNALNAIGNDYKDIYRTTAIKPEATRYELHRVWIVEGTVNADSRHVYAKRTMYIDEDTWTVLATDKYDGSGSLWRVGFNYPVTAPEVPVTAGGFYVHYDLKVGAYYTNGGVQGMKKSQIFDAKPESSSYFTPAAVRRRGR